MKGETMTKKRQSLQRERVSERGLYKRGAVLLFTAHWYEPAEPHEVAGTLNVSKLSQQWTSSALREQLRELFPSFLNWGWLSSSFLFKRCLSLSLDLTGFSSTDRTSSSDGCRAPDGSQLWVPHPPSPPHGLRHGRVPAAAACSQRCGQRPKPPPPLPWCSLQDSACHFRWNCRGGRGRFLTSGGGACTPFFPAVPGEPKAEHPDLPLFARGPQQHHHVHQHQSGLQWLWLDPVRGVSAPDDLNQTVCLCWNDNGMSYSRMIPWFQNFQLMFV